jgi:putative ABC transport system permease protein
MMAARWLTAARLAWRTLARREETERELGEEFAYHFEQLVEERTAAGLPREVAEAAARRAMRGAVQQQEECRDNWFVSSVDRFVQDVRYGWRRLRQSPATTMVSLLTLAVAIGANTVVFSLVNGVLLKRPPFPDLSRIVWMVEQSPDGAPAAVSAANYADWQSASRSFEHLAAWGFASWPLGDSTAPLQVRTGLIAPSYFSVFGVRPQLGRLFSDADTRPGATPVALLGHALWQTRFGADPSVVGRTIRLRGAPYEVVGVMPPEASRIQWGWPDVWTPLVVDADPATRGYHRFNTYAKLRAGVTIERARADMARVTSDLARAYPATNRGWSASLTPYEETLVGASLNRTLALLFGVVAAVLLIGCANVATMMLTQGVARQRELAIRCALGGGPTRLARQLLTESLLLAGGGGALGVVLAIIGVALTGRLLPAVSSPGAAAPPASLVGIDLRVLFFTLTISIGSALLVALLPLLLTLRPDLVPLLGDAGQTTTRGGRQKRLSAILIVAEVAAAFVLTTTSVALVRRAALLSRFDLGPQPERVLTATVPVTQEQANDDPARRARYLRALLDAVHATPGVTSAALTSVLPMQGSGSDLPFAVAGSQTLDVATAPTAYFKMVSPDYFRASGVLLRSGRPFESRDTAESPRVAVVNAALASRWFGARSPVGQRLVVPDIVAAGTVRIGPVHTWEIVGVVDNEHVDGPGADAPRPGIYVPLEQSPTRHPALIARTGAAPLDVASAIRSAIASINPDQALTDVQTLADMRDQRLAPDWQRSAVTGTFAAMAVLLASIGIYGMGSATVVRERRELALHAALGADPKRLAVGLFGRTLLVTAVGIAIGAALWAAGSTIIAALVGDRFAIGAGTALTAALVLVAGSAVGVARPGWRAARANPLDALRD